MGALNRMLRCDFAERCKCFLVHRLVANAFIKSLEVDEQVDHINGIHGDNRAENLRVMKTIEHARLHPLLHTLNARDPITGAFWPKGR